MLHLKVLIRSLLHNKWITFIHVGGLAIAFTFVLLLSFYVRTESSVDKFHEQEENIYRVLRDNTCAFSPPFADYVKEHVAGIKAYTRIFEMETVLKYDENILKTKNCIFVDTSFFSIFSFPFISGALQDKNDVAISESFSKAMFGNDNPLGKTIRINDRLSVTVSGIIKDFGENTHFRKPDAVFSFDLLTEFFGQNYPEQYDLPMFMPGLYVLAEEGVDMSRKGEELFNLAQPWYWLLQNGLNKSITFQPLSDAYFHPSQYGFPTGEREGNKTRLFIMSAIALAILLIVAINYINLSVAQSMRRAKDIGIRKIAGAENFGIIRQAMLETTVVCLISALLAYLLVLIALPFYNNLAGYHIGIRELISGDFMGIYLLLTVITILLIGIVPAFTLTRFSPAALIQGKVAQLNTTLIQKVLLTFQFFVSTTLIICMLILLKQEAYIRKFDLGFDAKETLYIPLNREFKGKTETLKESLKQLSGVREVSFCNGMPGVGIIPMTFDYKGANFEFEHMEIDDTYFRLMNIAVESSVMEDNSCWLNKKASQMLEVSSDEEFLKIMVNKNPMTYRIKGILPDIQFEPLYSEAKPVIFTKINTDNWAEYAFIRFDSIGLTSLIPELEKVYKQYSSIFPFEYYLLENTLNKAYEKEYRNTKIIIVFTIFALLISSLGVFALAFYFCQGKQKEMAIRKVNGATNFQIWSLIVRYFLRLVLISFVIACPFAGYFMNEWLSNFVYKTSLDLWIFALAGIVVSIISVLVVSNQSLWTVRQNPLDVLK